MSLRNPTRGTDRRTGMRRSPAFRIAFIVCVGLLAASCGGGESAGGDDTTTAAPPTTITTTTTTPDVSITPAPTTKPQPTASTVPIPLPSIPPGADPEDNADVTFAVADLATMLGVAEGDVTVIGWEEVVWRDGSIGCPVPGFAYTQALENGMRIALEVHGDVYWYHQGGGRKPFYCANPAQ